MSATTTTNKNFIDLIIDDYHPVIAKKLADPNFKMTKKFSDLKGKIYNFHI
jgi:hypothetical protein